MLPSYIKGVSNMAKTTYKHTKGRPFALRLSSWYKDWQSYFKSRTSQLLSRLWRALAIYAVFIFIFSAMFSALVLLRNYEQFLSSDMLYALEGLNTVFTLLSLGAALGIFGLCFVVLFFLSLHPKGRQIADRAFKFKDLTELGELEAKVTTIESELLSINKTLEGTKNRLRRIEATLNSFAKRKTRKVKGE
jgi:hypothetical protein